MSNYHNQINNMIEKIVNRVILLDKKGIKINGKGERISFFDLLIMRCIDSNRNYTISDVISEMEVDRGTVSNYINRLIAMKYMNKTRSPEDKRMFILSLTDEGEKVLDELKDKEDDITNFIMGDFTVNEKKASLKFMSRINQTMMPKPIITKK
ncbi:MAG: MarR family transcriptional regulator [Firmicutes bacterium]|nr:MarR family transcriptional regulator [Bacillota bacterium]